MYILGDIGNSDTKIFLVNKKERILKRTSLISKNINNKNLDKKIKFLIKDIKKVEKILFCSVVPKSFNLIKKYFHKKTKIRCYEIKNLNLSSLIKIKVNYKQAGSDRLANAISLQNGKDNFIILDFGTATTFDVVVKKYYRGGIIAPGIKISLDTLSDITNFDIARFCLPFGDEADDGVWRINIHFGRMRAFEATHVPSKLNHGHMHAQTNRVKLNGKINWS